jgi:hypothetical protein
MPMPHHRDKACRQQNRRRQPYYFDRMHTLLDLSWSMFKFFQTTICSCSHPRKSFYPLKTYRETGIFFSMARLSSTPN